MEAGLHRVEVVGDRAARGGPHLGRGGEQEEADGGEDGRPGNPRCGS